MGNEGHEGDEGCWCQEGGPQGYDGNSSLQLSGLEHRFEGEGGEGRRGELHVGCSGAVEEERVLQVRRRVEFEAEEEARDASSQGRQPIHQRAMRFQGEACVSDREGPCTETIQRPGQLISLSSLPSCKATRVVVGGLTRP